MSKKEKPKIFIIPIFSGEDKGDGGIRRCVEAQLRHFPAVGLEIVTDTAQADILLLHASHWVEPRPGQIVVAQTHGLYWTPEYEWDKWCYKVNRDCLDTMLKADIVLSPSEWVSQAIRRNTMIPAITITHGIDPDDWAPTEEPATAVQYVLWNKNRPDPVCDPTPFNKLAEAALLSGLDAAFVTTFGTTAPNVTITGRIPYADSKALVRNAAVYLATTRETFGVGTLEAMAAGVPVLGWNWGGQREIITHGVDGWLVQPGDYDGLLDGLKILLASRADFGAQAMATAQKHAWSSVARRYAQVLKDALARRAPVKVSVIIPCYNMMNYLPDAIDSVLASERAPSFEVVVVDDASTDDSRAVAQSYAEKDNRVRVVRNKENLYLAGALNAGIAAARGEYIVPLDADNMLTPKALYVLSHYLDTDRALDITYGKMEVRVQESADTPVLRTYISDWPPKEFVFREQLTHHNQISSTAMYRKKVWERVGGYRRRCHTAEDADFWCRATSFGARAARVTDLPTLVYRDRPDSMSHTVADWNWTAWYPWGMQSDQTPAAVLTEPNRELRVRTFEPIAVSVVIPVAPNHQKFVIDAIDSLVAQSFERWEVVCVFDSPESGGQPWLPPFVKVRYTGGGKGPAVARNMGTAASVGRFILPLDADDYLGPTALQDMLDAAARADAPVYVYTDWFNQEERKVYNTSEYNCADVLRQLPHSVTTLVPRAAWVRVGGFDEKIDAWEDWDFVIALNAAGYCGVRVPKPLLYYRESLGARREELYARREEIKKNIYAKWQDYISGEKKLMACGGCGKIPGIGLSNDALVNHMGQDMSQSVARATQVVERVGSVVYMEYVGENTGPITYRGYASGENYRFGRDSAHKVRPVAVGDVEHFLHRPEFRVVDGPLGASGGAESVGVFMEAAGPPKR